MADGRRNNRGTKGNKGGRPPKADEQKLIELLSPMAEDARKALHDNIQAGESWAVKMWFEYVFGKPKETINQTTTLTNIPVSIWAADDETETK